MGSVGAAVTETLQDGRFLVLEALGRGGMATVYRAFDRARQRMVALKVLAEHDRGGPSHPLASEFEAWSRVRHPNVVRVLELGHARCGPLPESAPYLVLEYFPGRPAHHVLAPGFRDSVTLEEFARRVLHGLWRVHGAGLVHRDLKPGNVLVRPARSGPGRIKLTDFGLAETTGMAEEPGCLSGSLPYVAPEAVLGEPIDGRADLYALGMLLFFLATGRPAAEGTAPAEIIGWHLRGRLPDPRSLRPELSDRLARFIRRCAARPREHRPASAEEALFLLGGPPPGRSSRAGGPAGLADRARLRLALDAARLGAVRFARLPRSRRAAELVREVRVQAEIRGLGFHTLTAASRGDGLAGLVYRLLLEQGDGVRAMIEHHRLHDGLPLGLLGGLPVWDRMKGPGFDARHDPAARSSVARGIAGFLLDAARRRTLVIHVESGAASDPLVAEVLRALARRRQGGLLLLTTEDQNSAEISFDPPT